MLKENILDHITQIDIKNRWKGILSQADLVTANHVVKKTFFLSPGEWNYAESLLSQYTNLHWVVEGGYTNAERKRLVIFPDYMYYKNIEDAIAILKISHRLREGNLTHRDYLGALLSLGIEREVIGDIVAQKDTAYLVTTPEMKDYIKFNLSTVGSVKVLVQDADCIPEDFEKDDMIILTGTVASLRVDSVISMALRISRQKSQSLVTAQKVKVNWIPVQKNILTVRERDMVSVSGYGRFKLLKVGNLSRSERWHIEVGKLK